MQLRTKADQLYIEFYKKNCYYFCRSLTNLWPLVKELKVRCMINSSTTILLSTKISNGSVMGRKISFSSMNIFSYLTLCFSKKVWIRFDSFCWESYAQETELIYVNLHIFFELTKVMTVYNFFYWRYMWRKL